jgi:hypothetical protein|eukprot:COSAG02_NODE_79_length_40228_cov_18.435762_13_plen_192_part_00
MLQSPELELAATRTASLALVRLPRRPAGRLKTSSRSWKKQAAVLSESFRCSASYKTRSRMLVPLLARSSPRAVPARHSLLSGHLACDLRSHHLLRDYAEINAEYIKHWSLLPARSTTHGIPIQTLGLFVSHFWAPQRDGVAPMRAIWAHPANIVQVVYALRKSIDVLQLVWCRRVRWWQWQSGVRVHCAGK